LAIIESRKAENPLGFPVDGGCIYIAENDLRRQLRATYTPIAGPQGLWPTFVKAQILVPQFSFIALLPQYASGQ
jgi:hypothetical protein